jgi:hypothetical protein
VHEPATDPSIPECREEGRQMDRSATWRRSTVSRSVVDACSTYKPSTTGGEPLDNKDIAPQLYKVVNIEDLQNLRDSGDSGDQNFR